MYYHHSMITRQVKKVDPEEAREEVTSSGFLRFVKRQLPLLHTSSGILPLQDFKHKKILKR